MNLLHQIPSNWEIHNFKEEVQDIIHRFEQGQKSSSYTECNFTYTSSGSTGNPTTSIHEHKVIKEISENQIDPMGLNKESVYFSIFPPTTIGLPTLTVLPAYISGAKLVLKKFDPNTYWDDIKHYKPTHHFFLPEIYRTMSKKGLPDLSFMKWAGTGSNHPVPGMKQELYDAGLKKFAHCYGATECGPSVSFGDKEEYLSDFCPDFQWRIQQGEWVIKWKSMSDWWVSGDMVEPMEDGVKILRRKKETQGEKRIIK